MDRASALPANAEASPDGLGIRLGLRESGLPANTEQPQDVSGVSKSEKVALVLDLPGEEGVWVGLALVGRGYRPVPLYNALPLPFGVASIDPVSQRSVAVVNVLPILSALRQGAEQLANTDIACDAPPAFYLTQIDTAIPRECSRTNSTIARSVLRRISRRRISLWHMESRGPC
jgi:hypothetical protein